MNDYKICTSDQKMGSKVGGRYFGLGHWRWLLGRWRWELPSAAITAATLRADTAITCTNTASGASWQIKIDYDHNTVDSNPASINSEPRFRGTTPTMAATIRLIANPENLR